LDKNWLERELHSLPKISVARYPHNHAWSLLTIHRKLRSKLNVTQLQKGKIMTVKYLGPNISVIDLF